RELQLERPRGCRAGKQCQEGRGEAPRRHHCARIARASCMSLRARNSGWRSRRWRNAASSMAPRMAPSLATKPAASSRAWCTILSSPEVLPDEAELPAAEVPALLPAKLLAAAGDAASARQASRARLWMRMRRAWAWGVTSLARFRRSRRGALAERGDRVQHRAHVLVRVHLGMHRGDPAVGGDHVGGPAGPFGLLLEHGVVLRRDLRALVRRDRELAAAVLGLGRELR